MRPSPPFDRLQRRLTEAWRARGVTLKAASFALVGVFNTFVDLGVFLAAYNVLKLPLIPANVLAWLVAALCALASPASADSQTPGGGVWPLAPRPDVVAGVDPPSTRSSGPMWPCSRHTAAVTATSTMTNGATRPRLSAIGV